MNQSDFAANLVKQFCRDEWAHTPDATPYQSGVPIDSIAPSTDVDDSPAQLWHTDAYQSLIGSIGWLVGATRPDIAPVHSFLLSYSNKPAPGHMKAALYTLHYVHSTYMTTGSPSLLPSLYPSIPIPTFTFWPRWMWRLTLMVFLHLRQIVHLSLLTATLVGDLRLALQYATALFSLFSNFRAWAVAWSFGRVGHYRGRPFVRIKLPLVQGKQKSVPQTKCPNQSWECVTWPRASNPVDMTF